MKIDLYHVQPFLGLLAAGEVNANTLRRIATFERDNLEEVFRDSNHIDQNWELNDDLTIAPGIRSARSTCVGDVMHELENDKWFVVDSIGMKEIPNPFNPAVTALVH